MGVPPTKYLQPSVTAVEKAVMAIAAQAPGWVTQPAQEKGQAALNREDPNAAQAKLMAWRGAELDGRRKLAERLSGLMITSNTSVRDFIAANDEIRTSMLAFQQGAYVVDGSKQLAEDGTAQVVVEIELKPLWRMVLHFQKKLSIELK